MATRRTAPPAEDTSDLRQRILDASERLLETEGLAALSMREVARRSGVTHQAPYHHFADRESILAELVTRGFEEMTRRLARANTRHAADSRIAVATECGQAYVGFAIEHPGLFRIMFRSEVCDPARFPAAQQAGDSAYRELEKMVTLIHGKDTVARLAPLYWAQVHGLASLIVDGPIGHQMGSARERRAFMREALAQFARFMLGSPLAD
ncbi:MAG: TetR/AcrR family transcriptional regulator [Hydrogenophaga sp.]